MEADREADGISVDQDAGSEVFDLYGFAIPSQGSEDEHGEQLAYRLAHSLGTRML